MKSEFSRVNSLVGDGLVANAAVDERGQLVGRLLDVSRVLGHGELLEKLVQDLDRLLVLGRHLVDVFGFFFSVVLRKRIVGANRNRWRSRLCPNGRR